MQNTRHRRLPHAVEPAIARALSRRLAAQGNTRRTLSVAAVSALLAACGAGGSNSPDLGATSADSTPVVDGKAADHGAVGASSAPNNDQPMAEDVLALGISLFASMDSAWVKTTSDTSDNGSSVAASSRPTGKAESSGHLTGYESTADFVPEYVQVTPPDISTPCPATPVANPRAQIRRVWLAQTHLMETHWPFFYLVQDRPALAKLDVTDEFGGPAPTVSVTAVFSDGTVEKRCLRTPSTVATVAGATPLVATKDGGADDAIPTSFAASPLTKANRSGGPQYGQALQLRGKPILIAPPTTPLRASQPAISVQALPAQVDMRPQPLSQDLSAAYVATLPAHWMRPDVTLKFTPAGGETVVKSPSDLRIQTRPILNFITADVLLFGDTQRVSSAGVHTEFGSKLPVTQVAYQPFPVAISLPRIVISPRTDSYTPTGATTSTGALWASAKPRCSSADKAAGTCLPHSGFSVLSMVYSLMANLKSANGMGSTSVWYGNLGANSAVGGGLGGGNQGSGDNYNLVFNHEMGHAMGLPHLGDVWGDRQTSATGLKTPYAGETTRSSDGQPVGGGYGRTFSWDPIDNGLVSPVCASTNKEQQEPMQRGCNTVRSGRRFDHFSDFANFKLLRYFNGASTAATGTVPYYSQLLTNTNRDKFAPTPYQLPSEGGRTIIVRDGNTWSLKRWDQTTSSYVELRRPPAGDTGFLSTPPAPPAGVIYDQYYDFRYPQQFNVPVYTVFGTFNYTDDAMSTIYGVLKIKGNVVRLWDPSDPVAFDQIKSSVSGDTFWWGYNLHLKVTYTDGSIRYVAMPYDVGITTNVMQGFTNWAVNLPDDGRSIQSINLLYKRLCVRNGAASDRACDLRLSTNGYTAANFYSDARVAATWTP